MRLQRLEIDNFRVIRRARLTLTDSVIGVVGPNGGGKSSLVEAISWVLYGNTAARSGKDEIKSVYAGPGADCRVLLEFALNGDNYTIERSLVGSRERPEARVLRGVRIEATGAADTVRFVSGLLGLDWRGFLTSFLARQQELNALADLAPQQRRDHLAGMLGIERLDRVLQKVKQDRRVLDERAIGLTEQVGRRDEVTRLLAASAEHIARLEPMVADAQGALQAAECAYRETDQLYREHQEKRVRCSEIEGRLESARRAEAALAEQIRTVEARRDELLAAQKRLAQLETQTVRLDSLKARCEQLRVAAARAALIEQLHSQQKAAAEALASLTARVAPLREQAARIEAELRGAPTDIESQVSASTAELEQIRSRFTDTRAEVTTAERELAKLGEQVIAIGSMGPEAVCDRCLRPFGDDLPEIRRHLESEQTALAQSLAGHRQKLEQLTRTGQLCKDSLTSLQETARRRRDLVSKADHLAQQLHDLELRRAETNRHRDELEGKLKEQALPEIRPGELTQVERELAGLERLRDEALQLKGQVADLPNLVRQLAVLREKREALDKELTDIESQRRTIEYDAAVLARVTEDYARSRQTLEAARRAHTEAVKEFDMVRHQQRIYLEEEVRLQKAAAQLDSCREDIFYSEKLGQLFGDFRKVMIAGIRPRLAELAGKLMTEMSGGKYSLVELDPDYNLRIMDFGQYYGIDRFSGGEKDLASLCLRLAISLALTESAGLASSFVILDEVFGSQDSGRRDLIMDALGGLKARFPQMILITHLEELKHKVETLIEVIPTAGGWSEVSCNGGTPNE